ncbi:enoyl-CoA hydratase/carnithine racemase [Nocardia transvalensis]|uniref:Enoyl-CoA hydratase/carnithine racemase n=1 Tax=Nocardia transvalensis TaxID=37333 RepID=A0A7W9UJF6_9NOCA|nr:enoyl-CoA hydratase-related protein [Nocardia transvalensis]MBB5915408.1 enoyl-CoA hydratase/carnithine racemase [Nocardia transvalensis]
MSDQDVYIDQDGPVLTVRLNRPAARNALTIPMMRAVGAAATAAEGDPGIRALVLTGSGDRAFCAGMDLRAFAEGDAFDASDPDIVAYGRLAHGELAVPVIGGANGSAVGGGLELLLGADIIVASSAAKFALPEVKRGLFPGGGGTALGTRIPLGVALEMTLTGDPITAARGYELGLVNAVVEPEQVAAAAREFADRVAANAPLGLAACKELVRLGVTDAARAEELLPRWQVAVFSSDDAKEGARAFVEKRAPVWRGL